MSSDLKTFAEEAQKHARDFQELDVQFFSSRPAKFARLARRPPRDDERGVRIGEEGFVYEMKLPAYIQRVEFTAEATATKPPSLKVEILPITDDPARTLKTEAHPEKPNVLVAEINAIVRGFRVSPEGWFAAFRSHKLTQVVAYGYSLTELENLEDAIFQYLDVQARFKAEVSEASKAIDAERVKLSSDKAALEAKAVEQASRLKAEAQTAADAARAEKDAHDKRLAKISKEAKERESESAELASEISKLKEESARLTSENAQLGGAIERLEKALDEQQKKERDLDQRIAEKAAELARKTDEEARLSDKLRELNNDVSLFADDMAGVAQQGDLQIKEYKRIIWACLLIFATLAGVSVRSALDVFNTFVAKPELGVWNLVGIKAPYVLIVAGVFHFLFKFSHPFLVKIREIHAKRLRLSEIGMLSREISDSALHGERITDEERAQVRLGVRMKFLREYLTGALDQVGLSSQEREARAKAMLIAAKEIVARGLPRRSEVQKEIVSVPALQTPPSEAVN